MLPTFKRLTMFENLGKSTDFLRKKTIFTNQNEDKIETFVRYYHTHFVNKTRIWLIMLMLDFEIPQNAFVRKNPPV